jgi:hypothetical protein
LVPAFSSATAPVGVIVNQALRVQTTKTKGNHTPRESTFIPENYPSNPWILSNNTTGFFHSMSREPLPETLHQILVRNRLHTSSIDLVILHV